METEVEESMVVSKMENTTIHGAIEGKTQTTEINMYSLDAIIAVGYRINSKKATEFRIWATKILKEYMTKGFALNDERFIKGNKYDMNYFNELLERIKTIRVSERMSYQKITDLFIATSTDYNPKSEEAYTFFKIVQNKLHYAIPFWDNHNVSSLYIASTIILPSLFLYINKLFFSSKLFIFSPLFLSF